ncbi:MAG: pyridoxine 5-phosphate synthase [Desulforhopalus sp.]
MPTYINIQCSTDGYPLQLGKLKRLANWLLKECDVADHDVSIALTDDQHIRQLNNQYRQKDSPTNVLSFPFSDGADQSTLSQIQVRELGDIVISLETALREAVQFNQTFQQRLSWLLIHGLLHLQGYDHERSKGDEKIMLKKEQELLNKLNLKRGQQMAHLAINVDHIATIRQARGITEPDPVAAASICELAGAAGIVVHLREDRRHIQDRDIYLLRETIKTKMNFEMGANKEIIKIALEVQPDLVTLVPEKRQELTTEGGLDIITQKKKIAKTIDKMSKGLIPVSLFLDPDRDQIDTASEIGATFVELHTGRYSDALSEQDQQHEFMLLEDAAEYAVSLGLRVNAGHGLNYQNTARLAALETIEELSIGHSIIARAAFSGLDKAVRDMLHIVQTAKFTI